MSFSATGAHKPLQSRIRKNPFLKRSSSSPFSDHPRRKPGLGATANPLKRSRTADEPTNACTAERLDDTGIVTDIPPPGEPQDVVSLMRYVRVHMWSEVPERSAGMNSTRIAEVLNFRRNLPPIVSHAHLHAVSRSATTTERELAALLRMGVVRKINIPGRGRGSAALGEGLVLMEDWTRLVQENESLDEAVKDRYLAVLKENPTALAVDATAFAGTQASDLVRAGFLTSTSALANDQALFSRPGAWSLGAPSVSKAGSNAATGTLAAVGGHGAVHEQGGGGKGLHPTSSAGLRFVGSLSFSLPSTGIYLRLVTEARAHLLELLTKSNPRFKEATKDMLRERWDGGIPADDAASRAKRARGEWTGVLPGKTKKWKTFNGMEFTWILEEGLGSGAVECFQTRSVGLGVRAT